MHRARFLEKLVQGIPKHVTHLNKRLVKISSSFNSPSNPSNTQPLPSSAGPITLHFADGTSSTADAAIGAEGIRSVVREHILGKELAEPVFANAVVFRNISGMEDVVEKLGEEYAGKASILCGPSKYLTSLTLTPLPFFSAPTQPAESNHTTSCAGYYVHQLLVADAYVNIRTRHPLRPHLRRPASQSRRLNLRSPVLATQHFSRARPARGTRRAVRGMG